MTPTPPYARPAATLILLRDLPMAPPEILMIERAATMAFAAGARVFPGGRVEPDDHALAARLNAPDPYEAAHRIAAIRETIEEIGLAVGIQPLPDSGTMRELRERLAAGAPFSELLERHGFSLELDALVPFARWCPPADFEARSFDTRFYAARADGLPPTASVDGSETTHLLWTTADAALRDAEAGRVRIVFPTLCNLERLALFGDFAALLDHLTGHPVDLIVPQTVIIDGNKVITIPENRGYPFTSRSAEGLSRR